ncbi:hypothetical protein HU200_002970 [Digitaria exilis]|uniref:Uncharacterized protein n=1 Tax=Digitaria exilis TaxID=1010633 RepID=A0A835FW40_9POAL|nr:hypothetical protein HU200_002970 [Digitaria exilis]
MLVGCVFTRQIWFQLLHRFGLASLAPQPNETSFDIWWAKADRFVFGGGGEREREQHRNDCVFNGSSPCVEAVMVMIREEAQLWSMAGAKGLSLCHASGIG